MDPLVVKFVEVLIMQVLVFGAIAAILVAAVWDVVQARVRLLLHALDYAVACHAR